MDLCKHKQWITWVWNILVVLEFISFSSIASLIISIIRSWFKRLTCKPKIIIPFILIRKLQTILAHQAWILSQYTSFLVGCILTSTCSGGSMMDMYMKGLDAWGNIAEYTNSIALFKEVQSTSLSGKQNGDSYALKKKQAHRWWHRNYTQIQWCA
jgi:hypothetical protein